MPKQIKSPLLKELGTSLRAAREAKALTQRDLAALVGTPQSHLSKIEQGAVDLQISSLAELARALDLELKLVPRQALPAIDGVIHSLTPRSEDAATSEAQALIQRFEAFSHRVLETHPGLVSANKLASALREVRLIRYDGSALRKLQDALAPVARFEHATGLSDHAFDLIDALTKAGSRVRQLRNAIVHQQPTSPVRQPLIALSEDDDD